MKRINKTRARNLFNKGLHIYILPCNVREVNDWIKPCVLSLDTELDFDRAVNAYEYYNCNNELGRYAKYYIGTYTD